MQDRPPFEELRKKVTDLARNALEKLPQPAREGVQRMRAASAAAPAGDDSMPWGLLGAIGLGALCIASVWYQVGFTGLFRYYAYLILLVGGCAVLWANRVVALLVFVVAVLALVGTYAGSRSPALDVLSVAVAASVTIWLVRSSRMSARPEPGVALAAGVKGPAIDDRTATRLTFVFLGMAWTLASLGDWWTQRAPITVAIPVAPGPASAVRAGLALSGGGYRAALYHAGVLQALEERHIPIGAIASVSGGSIIGAYYARGGAPAAFVDAVTEGRFNLARELLRIDHSLQIAASTRIPGTDTKLLAFVPDYDQTSVQADLLDRLFGGGVRHSEGSVTGRPPLMICVTDIAQRAMMGIMPSGYIIRSVEPPTLRFGFYNRHNTVTDVMNLSGWQGASQDLPGNARLADLVAASGAFPLAFPPVTMYASGQSSASAIPQHVLVDGGVGDNLGLAMADAAVRRARQTALLSAPVEARQGESNPWHVDFLIASDASAISPPGANARAPKGPVAAFDRTLDLIYDNGRLAEFVAGGSDAVGVPTVAISPALLLEHNTQQQPGKEIDFPFKPGMAPPARPDDIPPHSMQTTDSKVIQAIVARVPEVPRREALALIAGMNRDGLWPETGFVKTDDPRLRALHKILAAELSERVGVFRNTSTLRATFDAETAQSLFLLGYYLTLLDMRYIDCQLGRAQAVAANQAQVPACRPAPIVRMQLVGSN